MGGGWGGGGGGGGGDCTNQSRTQVQANPEVMRKTVLLAVLERTARYVKNRSHNRSWSPHGNSSRCKATTILKNKLSNPLTTDVINKEVKQGSRRPSSPNAETHGNQVIQWQQITHLYQSKTAWRPWIVTTVRACSSLL